MVAPQGEFKGADHESHLHEHYTALLPFKQKKWVACHQPSTLAEAIVLMQAYMLAKAGHYLTPKAWKEKQG